MGRPCVTCGDDCFLSFMVVDEKQRRDYFYFIVWLNWNLLLKLTPFDKSNCNGNRQLNNKVFLLGLNPFDCCSQQTPRWSQVNVSNWEEPTHWIRLVNLWHVNCCMAPCDIDRLLTFLGREAKRHNNYPSRSQHLKPFWAQWINCEQHDASPLLIESGNELRQPKRM